MPREMTPDGHRILLMHGRGLIGRAIRWQTRCQYAHAALYIGGGHVLEAWPPAVRVHYLRDWSRVDAYTHPGMKPADWERVERLMRAQLGKPYDLPAVLRFATGWQKDEDSTNERWFCFELVHYAMRRAGFPIAGIADSRIHGGHFEASVDLCRTVLPTAAN